MLERVGSSNRKSPGSKTSSRLSTIPDIHQRTNTKPLHFKTAKPRPSSRHTMFPQREILRNAPRFLRATAQRRLMSAGPAKAGESAFIKERQAVKEHAASSTGQFTSADGKLDALALVILTDHNIQSSGGRSPSSMTSPQIRYSVWCPGCVISCSASRDYEPGRRK